MYILLQIKPSLGIIKMIAYLELVFMRRSKILRTRKAAESWFTTVSYFYKNCLVSKNGIRHILLSNTSWRNLWLSSSWQCLPSLLGASPSFPVVMLMPFYSSRAWWAVLPEWAGLLHWWRGTQTGASSEAAPCRQISWTSRSNSRGRMSSAHW